MAHTNKYNYVEIEDTPDFKSLRIKDIKGFVRMFQEYEVKFIFKTEKKNTEGKHQIEFLFLKDQFLYRINGNNFKTLEDYEDAVKAEFPDAESFYDARKAGISTYKEYQDCKKIGVVDKALYTKSQKLGFLDSYPKFKERCEKNKGLVPHDFNLSDYDTPIKICEFATAKGFKDFGDFEKAFFLGFSDKLTYDEAKLKGFTYAEDYINAIKMGFEQIREYQEAKHMKIKSKYEYDQYNTLKKLSKGMYSFDQMVMIIALKNAENNKKLSLKKLKELLNQKEDEYKFITKEDGTRSFPEWYTKKLNTESEIRSFLTQGNDIKQYGIFDSDGEYFEVWKISNQKIYLDASNVAFASIDRGNGKPKLFHIKLVVEELKHLRFTDICAIADTSLRHKVTDSDMLIELKKLATYIESPAHTSADEFLISKAKQDKCCIVSNDTFKDWKMKDPWVAENIDRIRIPFLIDGDKVTFSEMEKIIQDVAEKV
ncbi:MAG: hypothetical protein V1781_01005 [Bacteroidota bacterium]